jgi:hypothetical protein
MGDDMNLGDYLVKLGRDREELANFLKNPERAMSEAGVPSDQRDAIIQGDVEQVQQLVKTQREDATVAFIVHWNWPIVHV